MQKKKKKKEKFNSVFGIGQLLHCNIVYKLGSVALSVFVFMY